MKELKFHHVHRRPKNPNGGVALRGGVTATFVTDYNEGTKECEVYYALARCSVLDNFSRPRGRAISSGRINKGMTTSLFFQADTPKEARFAAFKLMVEICDRELERELAMQEAISNAEAALTDVRRNARLRRASA